MSLVYYADARARTSRESLLEKLGRIVRKSELQNIVSPGDNVFIKCHMGAPLTTRYLRPIFVRRIVEEVKLLGGKPVVVETTGLGLLDPRGTADKYMEVAASHGYTPETIGTSILVADGRCGLDAMRARIEGLRSKEISLAGALRDADVLIGLAHLKGHMIVGLGGAIKNIAIGLSSKEGKYLLHYEEKPKVNLELCNRCSECLKVCPSNGAIELAYDRVEIDPNLCAGCLACLVRCEAKAIVVKRRSDALESQVRLADMASAVMDTVGRENVFFVNFVTEVDWLCDCEHGEEGWSDMPIVPDIGITASTDPVALDMASVDLVNSSPGIPGSKLQEVNALDAGADKFRAVFPNVDWKETLMACEKLGVGTVAYKLVTVD